MINMFNVDLGEPGFFSCLVKSETTDYDEIQQIINKYIKDYTEGLSFYEYMKQNLPKDCEILR